MKGRVLALGALLALFAAFLTRGAGPGPVPARSVPASVAPPLPEAAPIVPSSVHPSRDPFRYVDEAVVVPVAPVQTPEPQAAPELAATPPPLRLFGFVRRGNGLLAALSLHGVVVTAAAGDSAEGYVVLSVDEDSGVRLRGPDGADVVLALPPE
jgi:hypothetical protein